MVDIPKIPGYRIEKKLAEGGMSTVYMGIQEKLSRKVAIKILDPSLLKNKMVEIRFLQEAETAANMYHSNIISIYDIGRVGDYSYMVMEFLEETLKDHLLGHPEFVLKPEKALDILKPIVEALYYAHSRGIIHRDIKSENIMLRGDGTPVLTDFGIARALDSDSHMTKTGMSVGTPYYMSPEQCKAQQVDGRSDIYSLGVVLFEILTGQKPYDADSPMGVALKHVQDPVPQLPEELNPYQPLIDKMMAKRKEDRAANCEEVLELMDSVLKHAKQATVLFTPIPGTGPEPVNLPLSGPPLEPDPGTKLAIEAVPAPEPGPPPMSPPEPLDEFEPEPPPPPPPKPEPAPVWVSESAPSVTRKSVPAHRKFPVKKVVEAAVLGLLLVVVFIIFYSLGSKGTKQKDEINSSGQQDTTAAQPVSPTPSSALLQQNSQYRADYNQALDHYKNGDYEKAWELVNGLKAIRSIPEVNQLGEKIAQQLQAAQFNTYFSKARNYLNQKNFSRAKENILLAKEINPTPQVLALEKRINDSYIKYQKRLKQQSKQAKELKQADDRAYDLARSINTIDAYRKYMDEFPCPSGSHVEEAIARLNTLEEAERLRKEAAEKAVVPKVKLRSRYKILSLANVAAMIQRNNFFENEFNKTGNFKNEYKKQFIKGDAVVTDTAADLMWYAGGPSKTMTFKRAEKWAKSLNTRRYAGYMGWRLPTLEEAVSLLRKGKNAAGLYIAPAFSGHLRSIWTGDLQRTQTYWVVRFYQGIVFADSERSSQSVLAVRSIR